MWSWVIQQLNKDPRHGLHPQGGHGVSFLFHVVLWLPLPGPPFLLPQPYAVLWSGPSLVPAAPGR